MPAKRKQNKVEMNFKNFRVFSQLHKSNNGFKILRSYSERRPAPDLPTSRGEPKISGFGKFLFVILLFFYEIFFLYEDIIFFR